jgi:hypothetical protein
MTETLLVALITGGLSLAGVVFSSVYSNKKTTSTVTHKLELHQAVTDTKLEALRTEVNKHNNVIERVFILEGQMAEVQHDVRDLKAYHKPTA